MRGKKGSWNYYGNTDDSRIEAINKPLNQPRVWAISLTHDAGDFNMTKYFYTEDSENGAFYLEKIVTGKTGAAALGYEVVELYYVTIIPGYIDYREGAKVKTERNVKTIVSRTGCNNSGEGGVIKKAYSLTWAYMAKTMVPVINAIKEYGADAVIDENGDITEGSSLSPATFEYSGITEGFGGSKTWKCSDKWNLRYSTYPGNNSWFDFMDINGDSLMDRIKQGHDDTVSGGSSHDDFRFRIQLNTGKGFASTEVWSSNGKYLRHYNSDNHAYTYDYMDINGDGRPDRVWQNSSSVLNVKYNTGEGFGSAETMKSAGEYLRKATADGDTTYDYFDMNGDGLLDRVWQNGNSILNIRFNNGEEFGPTQAWQSSGNYLRDVDNDDGHTRYDYMDMNGDGLPDRIWQNNDNRLYIKYNTGSGFEPDAVFFLTQDKYLRRIVTSDDNLQAHTASEYMDINGDGLPDRLVQSNNLTLTVQFNTGYGFFQPVTFASNSNYVRQSDIYFNTHLKDYFDMNGDGFLDRVYRNSEYPDFDDPVHIRFSESEYPRENYLLKINHPAGGSTIYSYKPVDKCLNPGYKYNKWVVESITTDDGFGNEEKIEYEFSEGLLDTASKEDKGFRKVVKKNSTGGSIETYYYQNGPESGLIEKIIERSDSGKIIKYLDNIYEDYAERSDHYGYGVVQDRDNAGPEIVVQAVKLTETIEYIVDGNTENDLGTMPEGMCGYDWHARKKQITYDSYGNKIKITSGDYTNDEWTLDKNEMYFEYINNTEYWMFLQMRKYGYSYNKDDTFVKSDEKRIFYDYCEEYGDINGRGLPTKIQLFRSETDFITKKIVYDEYGNIIETIDPEGNSTTYEYDPIFRIYKTKEMSPGVNGINLVIQIEYNTYCLPEKIIDPGNSVTELIYDTFHRLIKKVLPYDSETYPTEEYEYHEADNSTDGDGTEFSWTKKIVREVRNTAESLEIYSYMDGVGRTIQIKSETIDDSGNPCWLAVNNWQYIQGKKRIKAASMPSYSSYNSFDRPLSPEGACTYDLAWFQDDEGHIREKQNSSSTPLISRIYSKLNKTIHIDAAGHVKITTAKPWENKISIINCNGEFPNHEYYTWEETKTTFNATSTMDYENNYIYSIKDWLGNTLLTWDGDTGETSYQYDDNGNIVEKTDEMGNVITYSYDALNRLTTKMLPGENSINYYYDGIDETIGIPFSGDHGEGLGKLTRVVLQNGIDGENYTYDMRGRIIKVARIIDGERRFLEKEYDSMDRVVKEILPGGEEVISSYSSGGMLTSLVGDESYITNLTYTASGQIDSMTYGNGIIISYNYYDEEDEYDPATNLNLTYRLESISTSDGSTMDLNYQYDKSGNIIMKNNWLNDEFSEVFIYDDFNRLVEAESTMYGRKIYEYDRINNIIEKDGYEYQYHEDKPHAVVSDGRSIYTYDANGNMTRALGQSRIIIMAKGTGVKIEPPEMQLWFNGEKKMSWLVTNTEYKEYTWFGYWDGNSTIDVKLVNRNQAGGENTDLYIDWVEVNGIRKQAEEPDVYFDATNVDISGSTITKTMDTLAWDAGAASRKTFTGSGGVEFTPAQNDKRLICGLSDEDTDTSPYTIDYGINLGHTKHFSIYENGVNVTPVDLGELQYYNQLTTFQIVRVGNSIVYKRDGVEIYRSESAVDPDVELMVDCAFYDNGAALSEVKRVDIDTVSFIDTANVEFMSNVIAKNVDTLAWDAGAASLKTFTGSGGVEFTPAQNDKRLICGLSDENTDTGYNTIDYGIILNDNMHFSIVENGIDVTPADIGELQYYNHLVTFQILRQGNTIVYKRDEVEIYRSESAVDPDVELMVDCAFYDNGAALSEVKWVDIDTVSFIDTLNVDFMSNVIAKDVDTLAWDAGAASLKTFTGSGGVEFTPAQNDKRLICGLSDEHADTSPYTVDYGIVLGHTKHFSIFENGVNVTPADLGELQYYNQLTTFQVVRVGNNIVYKRDGVEIYRSESVVDPAVELMVDCAFYDNGAALSEVKWVREIESTVNWLYEVPLLPGREQLDECGTLSFSFTGVPLLDRSITYDTENRVSMINDSGNITSFEYDAAGQRMKKTENGSETYYFFKNYEEVIESGNTKKIFHYFANSRRIAQRIITGTDNKLLYIHSDHLGSSVKLTDRTGETVQAIAYDPYGKTVYSGGVNELSYQFTGQEFEQGTGLYYYGARYYDPVLGRFLSPDPVLAGLNRYAYCYNNPVMYIDPSGNNPVVNFLIYSALYLTGAYLSGVSSSGSWNPATWSGDVWTGSFLWPLQAVNGISWSSNGSVDVYYTSGGSGTIYDPGAIAGEQMYYAWETEFNILLQKHMYYYTRYYDDGKSGDYYAMGNTDYDSNDSLREKWVNRMYSIILSDIHTPISTAYSSTLDIMGVVPDLFAIGLREIGWGICEDAFDHLFNDTSWNMALGKFRWAYGEWVQFTAVGIMSGEKEKYFADINYQLETARNDYLQYLKLIGVDIENIDIKKLDYE
ncbi:MAG: hypothetical protein JXB88_13140 [Spirochaetales bacterium]|nr:hypothetical protein [Spirochaetales bacterium]